MTVGILTLIIVLGAVVVFFLGGKIAQRIDNGHWGKASTWYYETPLWVAGIEAIFAVLVAAGVLVLFVFIFTLITQLWDTPL